MRVLSKLCAIGLLAAVSALAACGGPSDSPPGPLGKHFDDMYIAAIPLEQKQSVVQTQNDWSLAKMQNAKAEADYNEAVSQLSVVRNDQKATHLAVDSAVSQKKSADQSADTNRVNQATKDLHTAEDLSKAAEARTAYFEAYVAYLKRHWRWAQENMYWREAQYEQAKAQLAQKSNIAPKGNSYDWYPKQEQERSRRAASAKDKQEAEHQHAQAAREAWMRVQKAADEENGHPSALPDPMAKAETTSSSP